MEMVSRGDRGEQLAARNENRQESHVVFDLAPKGPEKSVSFESRYYFKTVKGLSLLRGGHGGLRRAIP